MKRTLTLALLLATLPAVAGVIEGRVIEVPDGATLTILSKAGASIHRVRLAGIDAPDKDRALGGRSRESLRRMARGKAVRVDTNSIDPRGLLVGAILVERGAKECTPQPCAPLFDPGLTQISSGLAKIDPSNVAILSQETQRLYAAAEQHARANRLGVWRENKPVQAVRHDGPPVMVR